MTTKVMTVFFISFLFQYLPKIYHSVCLLRRLQSMLGYVFGTIWGGIALNLIAYFVASHVIIDKKLNLSFTVSAIFISRNRTGSRRLLVLAGDSKSHQVPNETVRGNDRMQN